MFTKVPKYRVYEEVKGDGLSDFYVQKRKWFIWRTIDDSSYATLERANSEIARILQEFRKNVTVERHVHNFNEVHYKLKKRHGDNTGNESGTVW